MTHAKTTMPNAVTNRGTAAPGDALVARYDTLPDLDKIILRFKAVLGPDVAKDRLYKALWSTRLSLPGGKLIARDQAENAIARAGKSGLWEALNRAGSQLSHHVTVEAFASPQAGAMLNAARTLQHGYAPAHYLYASTALRQELRLALYSNDGALLEQYFTS